jgi:hypothetical protein
MRFGLRLRLRVVSGLWFHSRSLNVHAPCHTGFAQNHGPTRPFVVRTSAKAGFFRAHSMLVFCATCPIGFAGIWQNAEPSGMLEVPGQDQGFECEERSAGELIHL